MIPLTFKRFCISFFLRFFQNLLKPNIGLTDRTAQRRFVCETGRTKREYNCTRSVGGNAGGPGGIDTVAVLVEEAESFLELGNLLLAELVRHGDGTERPRRRGKHARQECASMARLLILRWCAGQGGSWALYTEEWKGPTIGLMSGHSTMGLVALVSDSSVFLSGRHSYLIPSIGFVMCNMLIC
jgi:hypothetical protein